MPEQAMSATELRIRVVPAIAGIAAAEWDACANPKPCNLAVGRTDPAPECAPTGSTEPHPTQAESNSPEWEYNPFISHDFLHALEASGSAAAKTGWQPQHLVAETADGRLLGALPCYLKSHSRGEYVFDHGWADAYERAGGSYYPKLQVSVPFTPATGRRLLARAGPYADAVRAHLADALTDICRRAGASSVHVTFPTEPEWDSLGARGYLKRTHQQFHWENAGYP